MVNLVVIVNPAVTLVKPLFFRETDAHSQILQVHTCKVASTTEEKLREVACKESCGT